MEEATSSFSDENFLGKGGFGRVYKGTLRSGEVCATNIITSFQEDIKQSTCHNNEIYKHLRF